MPALDVLPTVAELRRRFGRDYESRPGRLLAWVVFDWTILYATWYAMAHSAGAALVSVTGTVIVASRLHALGALLHDACHCRDSRGTPAWRLVEALAGWPIASTIDAMRYHHLRHHRFSGTALDPYRHVWIDKGHFLRGLLVLRGVLLPLWWTLRGLVAPAALVFPGARTSYARAFLQDRSDAGLRDSPEVIRCLRSDLLQLTAQTLAFVIAFRAELPIVEYYLVPWMLAGLLNARRVLVEHAAEESSDSARTTVYAATHNHDNGLLLNALLYPHHIGLHRTHHLYPTASFVHLPRLTALVESG